MPPKLATWSPPRLSPWEKFRREPTVFLARWLHHHRPPLPPRAPVTSPITIVCLSDTHQAQPNVPDGDLFLHAGDLTDRGTFEELQAQLDWIASLPHRYKVVIGGNHDRILDADFVARSVTLDYERKGASYVDLNWHHIIYLNNSSRTLQFAGGRSLSIFGSPWTPECGNFAFQYPPIRNVWSNTVPDGTDVVLIHGPPRGFLDLQGKGCPHLTREVARVRPRLVVFGHIHDGHGREEVEYRRVETSYSRAMAGDTGLMHIISTVYWFLMSWAWSLLTTVRRGESTAMRTTMINAAIGCGPDKKAQRSATVVEI